MRIPSFHSPPIYLKEIGFLQNSLSLDKGQFVKTRFQRFALALLGEGVGDEGLNQGHAFAHSRGHLWRGFQRLHCVHLAI